MIKIKINKKSNELDGMILFYKMNIDYFKQRQNDIDYVMHDKGERITDSITRLPWIANTYVKEMDKYRKEENDEDRKYRIITQLRIPKIFFFCAVECYYESKNDAVLLIPRCITMKVDIVKFIYDMLDGKYASKKEMISGIDYDVFDTLKFEFENIKKECYFLVESVSPRSELVIGINSNINGYKLGFDMKALHKIVYDT